MATAVNSYHGKLLGLGSKNFFCVIKKLAVTCSQTAVSYRQILTAEKVMFSNVTAVSIGRTFDN